MRKYEEQLEIQRELATQVVTKDELPKTIRYVAGTDVSYSDEFDIAVAVVAVLDVETKEIVETQIYRDKIVFPYISGLFSFREVPPLLEAYKQLTTEPDLIICDAQGIAHPRGLGMASHLGLLLDKPTIGCGKTKLVGSYDTLRQGKSKGDMQDLIYKNQLVGKVVTTRNNTLPIFVSIGHKVSLDTATDWVLKMTTKYRLPETTRVADKIVKEELKKAITEIKDK